MFIHTITDKELRVLRPPVVPFREFYLLLTERVTMDAAGVSTLCGEP